MVRSERTPDSDKRRKSTKRKSKKSLNAILRDSSYDIRGDKLIIKICLRSQTSLKNN
jgi:hypothetical protein